jgi:hypothetical protein
MQCNTVTVQQNTVYSDEVNSFRIRFEKSDTVIQRNKEEKESKIERQITLQHSYNETKQNRTEQNKKTAHSR